EPVILAAERLDAGLVAAKLSALLPRALAVGLTGSHVNLTWQGFYRDGEIREWGGGMVFARPVVDVRTSGEWWRCLGKMADAIARELPDWGGGDAAELGALVKQSLLPFDQLSVVAERDEDGHFILEFRAYGDAVGQATGVFDRLADGSLTGEFLLAGPSRLLDAAASANPELGTVLRMLANDSLGLRVTFAIPAGGSPEFTFPFLEDAVRLRAAMQPLEGHP
ncbi:MAG: hypothetical protein LIP77_10495, partial [Planctomycetes bacterium]|nr:hypothetical protein [Planctomycetota bacterium]